MNANDRLAWALAGPVAEPAPPKPKRMSERRYRALYDSDPVYVVVGDRMLFRCAGRVSGYVLARTYEAKGETVSVHVEDGAR